MNPFETPTGAPRLSVLAGSLYVERLYPYPPGEAYRFYWECEMLEEHQADVAQACDLGWFGYVYSRAGSQPVYRPTLRAWYAYTYHLIRLEHRNGCFPHARDVEQWVGDQADKLIRDSFPF